MIRLAKRMLCIACSLVLAGAPLPIQAKAAGTNSTNLDENVVNEIQHHIEKYMDLSKIPGLSVAVLQGDTEIYQECFGYADVQEKTKVTEETLFELGSNSKAFTALAILKLNEEGVIHIEDSVHKYIPWLTLKYEGEAVDVTLEQFLHHTSGVGFQSISYIEPDESEDALEQAVKALSGSDLVYAPGKEYSYATINYDVLGLVIETVTGESYEDYMDENIFEPNGLKETFLSRKEAEENGTLAKGYKVGFLNALEYQAPVYKGNAPAGYIISNSNDMCKWLEIQMQTDKKEYDEELITQSHVPNHTVRPYIDGSYYADGWMIYGRDGVEILHGGSNPNYSSFIVFRPEEKIGVIVLANLDSSYTETIGLGILDIIEDTETPASQSDSYVGIDKVCTIGFGITMLLSMFVLWRLIHIIRQTRKGKRVRAEKKARFVIACINGIALPVLVGYALYRLPDVAYMGLPWNFIAVWGPISLPVFLISLEVFVLLAAECVSMKILYRIAKK